MMREDKEVDMKPVIALLGEREGRFARWEFFWKVGIPFLEDF